MGVKIFFFYILQNNMSIFEQPAPVVVWALLVCSELE